MLLPYMMLASYLDVDCCCVSVYVSYNNCHEPLLGEDNNDKFEIFSPGKETVVKMQDDIQATTIKGILIFCWQTWFSKWFTVKFLGWQPYGLSNTMFSGSTKVLMKSLFFCWLIFSEKLNVLKITVLSGFLVPQLWLASSYRVLCPHLWDQDVLNPNTSVIGSTLNSKCILLVKAASFLGPCVHPGLLSCSGDSVSTSVSNNFS